MGIIHLPPIICFLPRKLLAFFVDLFTLLDGSTFVFLYFWIQLRQSRAECLPIELKTHLKKVRVAFEDECRPGCFSCCDGITNGISENNRERGQGEINVKVKGHRLEDKKPPDRAESCPAEEAAQFHLWLLYTRELLIRENNVLNFNLWQKWEDLVISSLRWWISSLFDALSSGASPACVFLSPPAEERAVCPLWLTFAPMVSETFASLHNSPVGEPAGGRALS